MATVKAGNFTAPNNTNNQSITGLGFQPGIVMHATGFRTVTGNSLTGHAGFGAGVSSTERAAMLAYLRDNQVVSQSAANFESDMMCVSVNNSDVGSNIFDFVSQDADGFTIDWLAAGTWIVPYLALSDDIDAKVGTFDLNTSTGNQAITGVGFQPDLVLFFTTIANTTEGGRAGAHFCFGAADAAGNVWSIAAHDVDAADPMDNAHILDNTKCFTQINTASVLAAADIVSMDADGFTVDVTTAPGASIRIGYVALGGINAKVGTITQKTSTGTEAYTGVGFTPIALIFGIAEATAAQLGTIAADWHAGIGFATGSADQNYSLSTANDAAATSNTRARLMTDKCLGEITASAGGITAEAALSSMDADGFTLDWTTSDGTARVFGYVALDVELPVGAGPGANVFVIAS